MIFYNSVMILVVSIVDEQKQDVIGNDFLFFIRFHGRNFFYCSPCRFSGAPEYACCVNKLRQNVGLQTSKWRHILTSQTAYFQ